MLPVIILRTNQHRENQVYNGLLYYHNDILINLKGKRRPIRGVGTNAYFTNWIKNDKEHEVKGKQIPLIEIEEKILD